MRQPLRPARGFAIPAGSSLILLTAICAALLSAEPPVGRHALRHFENQVVKAKTILHHLSAASPAQDSAQIRELVEGLLEIRPFLVPQPLTVPLAAMELPRPLARVAPCLFQRPPPSVPAA